MFSTQTKLHFKLKKRKFLNSIVIEGENLSSFLPLKIESKISVVCLCSIIAVVEIDFICFIVCDLFVEDKTWTSQNSDISSIVWNWMVILKQNRMRGAILLTIFLRVQRMPGAFLISAICSILINGFEIWGYIMNTHTIINVHRHFNIHQHDPIELHTHTIHPFIRVFHFHLIFQFYFIKIFSVIIYVFFRHILSYSQDSIGWFFSTLEIKNKK